MFKLEKISKHTDPSIFTFLDTLVSNHWGSNLDFDLKKYKPLLTTLFKNEFKFPEISIYSEDDTKDRVFITQSMFTIEIHKTNTLLIKYIFKLNSSTYIDIVFDYYYKKIIGIDYLNNQIEDEEEGFYIQFDETEKVNNVHLVINTDYNNEYKDNEDCVSKINFISANLKLTEHEIYESFVLQYEDYSVTFFEMIKHLSFIYKIIQ